MNNNLINFNEFKEILEKTVYKNAKSDLLKKVASYPDRYVGIFRPTTPEVKLIQNITQSHEISFGDFIEDIITRYLGVFYTNIEKRHMYKDETILFDQLFEYNGKIFMLEQKMRDDHDSTKKRGQFENFVKKVEYLKETYPTKEIVAGMWFVDPSLTKNKNYYQVMMDNYSVSNTELHLFYGDQFLNYLDKISIWDEMTNYLVEWKMSEDNRIELNFETNWNETKQELLENVTVSEWKKLINNPLIISEIFPILFPTNKYVEILEILEIDY